MIPHQLLQLLHIFSISAQCLLGRFPLASIAKPAI
jgi:hypothetical protein